MLQCCRAYVWQASDLFVAMMQPLQETMLILREWESKDKWDRYIVSTGSFKPNGYGLNDIAGNGYEWCAMLRITADFIILNTDEENSSNTVAADLQQLVSAEYC